MTTAITAYRAFFVGSDGRFQCSAHLDCASDAEAIREAAQLTDQGDIELWRGASRIATLIVHSHQREAFG